MKQERLPVSTNIPPIPEELPIPTRTFRREPCFDIEKFLVDESGRVECSFEQIQQYLEAQTEHRIPRFFADFWSRTSRWQLFYPENFDLSQLVFIGKTTSDKGYIQLEEAEAAVYIHRGVDPERYSKRFNVPLGEYGVSWLELSGVFPDSNGDPRILTVYYRLHPWNKDFSSQSMRVSIREDEMIGLEKKSDDIFGPVLTMPTVLARPKTYSNKGIITNGMLSLAPGQRRLLVTPFYNGPYSVRMVQMHNAHIWEIGLNETSSPTPWILSVPDFLETGTKALKSGNARIQANSK